MCGYLFFCPRLFAFLFPVVISLAALPLLRHWRHHTTFLMLVVRLLLLLLVTRLPSAIITCWFHGISWTYARCRLWQWCAACDVRRSGRGSDNWQIERFTVKTIEYKIMIFTRREMQCACERERELWNTHDSNNKWHLENLLFGEMRESKKTYLKTKTCLAYKFSIVWLLFHLESFLLGFETWRMHTKMWNTRIEHE